MRIYQGCMRAPPGNNQRQSVPNCCPPAGYSCPQGRDACIIGRIGHIVSGDSRVILETELGGRRVLDELEGDPLPRIC